LTSSAVVWEGKERANRYRALNKRLSHHLEQCYKQYLAALQTNQNARNSLVNQTDRNFEVIPHNFSADLNYY